jgi:prepilin-type N-terminal cleavage/methylation domain-containing protein
MRAPSGARLSRGTEGFTLVEVLVTLGVLSVLFLAVYNQYIGTRQTQEGLNRQGWGKQALHEVVSRALVQRSQFPPLSIGGVPAVYAGCLDERGGPLANSTTSRTGFALLAQAKVPDIARPIPGFCLPAASTTAFRPMIEVHLAYQPGSLGRLDVHVFLLSTQDRASRAPASYLRTTVDYSL